MMSSLVKQVRGRGTRGHACVECADEVGAHAAAPCGEGDAGAVKVMTRAQGESRVVAGVTFSPAAARALDVDPGNMVRRWLSRLSSSAHRFYRTALGEFAAWCSDGAEREPVVALRILVAAGVGPAHEMVRAWVAHLQDRGLSPGTVCSRVTGLASLCSALRQAGVIDWRLERLAPRYERVENREGPRRGHVEQLLAVIDDAAAAGSLQAARDAALVRCLYSAALRRGEAVGLRFPDDVDLHAPDGPLVRPRRKGKRQRADVLVSQRCAEALQRWIDLRGCEPGFVFHALKVRRADRPLSGEALRKNLDVWRRKAGIRSAVRPHGLRHSSASECARRGSLAQVMALGDWESYGSATRYLDHRMGERRAALGLVDV